MASSDIVVLLFLLCCCLSSVTASVGLFWNCNDRSWDTNNFHIDNCTNFDFGPSPSPSPSPADEQDVAPSPSEGSNTSGYAIKEYYKVK